MALQIAGDPTNEIPLRSSGGEETNEMEEVVSLSGSEGPSHQGPGTATKRADGSRVDWIVLTSALVKITSSLSLRASAELELPESPAAGPASDPSEVE